MIYSSTLWLLLLLVACPGVPFSVRSFEEGRQEEALNEENARMINYIGLVILVGNTLIVALNNLLNYIQINKFVSMSEHRIEYAFSIEWAGIIMGLFILAVGTIYGYACSVAAHEKETLITAVARSGGTEVRMDKDNRENKNEFEPIEPLDITRKKTSEPEAEGTENAAPPPEAAEDASAAAGNAAAAEETPGAGLRRRAVREET